MRFNATLIASVVSALSATTAVTVATLVHGGLAMAVVVIGAMSTALVVWSSLASLPLVTRFARNVMDGKSSVSSPPRFDNELSICVKAITELYESRTKLGSDFQQDLSIVARGLVALNDPKREIRKLDLSGRFPDICAMVGEAFGELSEGILTTRRQLSLATRTVHGIPEAILVVDTTGALRFLNRQAEHLFGPLSRTGSKRVISSLFAGPPSQESILRTQGISVANPYEVLTWLKTGARGRIVARVEHSGSERFYELSASNGANSVDPQVYIVCRDMTDQLGRELKATEELRARTFRRVIDRYLLESGDSLSQVAAQTRLLLGEAKQSSLREAMVPRLSVATRGIRQLETFHELLHWYRDLVWSQGRPITPSEFTGIEVANIVADRLSARFKARGNRLKIVDQGGWVYSDAEWLEVALLGFLVHACDATINQQIELRVTRYGISADRPRPQIEYHVVDAGSGIPSDLIDRLQNHFRERLLSKKVESNLAEDWPIALVVASRIASALGGELRIGSRPNNRLALRLTIPTRVGADTVSPVASTNPSVLNVAPFEETVSGWRLGDVAAASSV
jgi:hypothetical protein